MGLLTLGLVLAASVAMLELYIVHSFRPEKFEAEGYPKWNSWAWRVVYNLGPWIESSPVHGLIFSMGLSIAIGMLFPAMGVTVMLAGVVSTIGTQPVYAFRRWYWRRFAHKAVSTPDVIDIQVVREERRAG